MTTFDVDGGGSVRGSLRVPGDKSISHRALLLGAVAKGTSKIDGLSNGKDVARTAAAVKAMGARVTRGRVTGGALHEPATVIDVGNSGTSIRLLAGYCAAFPWLTVLEGDASIATRPMDRVTEPLRAMGARIDGRSDGGLAPLVIRGGGLTGIDYTPPMASAQVKSAVLLAGLGAEGETVVREPVATRAHTEEMLALAGADISVEDGGHTVRVRRSVLTPFEITIPGDPSQAAFWVVAALITPGSELTIENVYAGAARTGFLGVLRRMGASIDTTPVSDHAVDITARTSTLHATVIDGDEIPSLDEVPALAVAAALAEGDTEIVNAHELRLKESDRIATVVEALQRLGADAMPTDDGLVVRGGRPLTGATVDSHGDHRVAMATAIAGLVARGTTRIEGWESVATSYPSFGEDLRTCR
ncbi:MAG TPA: 3-phosphoshikimate 1-carboxyvinyltransferase [Acidimicrobiales bacterium]|nr:3-phosphoshikimate 1-carboxyvinyltransferase [Acidimicrobiales bacterium]